MSEASPADLLTVQGVALEVRRWAGAGVPIVLLHEGLGSVSMWRDFPDRLAARTGRPVIAWSRQGYGRSDALPVARDPDYMHVEAGRVAPLLDALGIERVILFGHSDGASIALIAAACFPDRVERLILEAPHVYVEQLTIDSIAAVGRAYRGTDLPLRLGRHHQRPDQVFWRWKHIWLDRRFRDWNIEDVLPAIRAPALLIQGQDDEYGTLDQIVRIERALADTRRLVLPTCGHSPHRDQPEAVLAAVDAFLVEPFQL